MCIFETGGQPDARWKGYLERNLPLNEVALDSIPSGTYQAVVSFEVDPTGKIINVAIRKDPGFGLGKRLQDIVNAYPHRWTPAKYWDRPTKVYRQQSATFIVEEWEEEEPSPNECGGSVIML